MRQIISPQTRATCKRTYELVAYKKRVQNVNKKYIDQDDFLL